MQWPVYDSDRLSLSTLLRFYIRSTKLDEYVTGNHLEHNISYYFHKLLAHSEKFARKFDQRIKGFGLNPGHIPIP